MVSNLVILGFFKYFNFFADNLNVIFRAFGISFDIPTQYIILPLGISFYTFQTMSYAIDVYRGRIKASRKFHEYFLYVTFFPQLVAGPIERASRLLPQITSRRRIQAQQVEEAMFLILWGYFKKRVIADNLGALLVDPIFSKYGSFHGFDLVLAVMAFSIQIYGDFSGYSDIARGVAKMMGFELMANFHLPYFALNPRDFWRRWHISLSTWLQDYLYIPLGGNKHGPAKTIRNLTITMLLGGLWHGARWNFVLWGLYHGLILIVYRFLGQDRDSADNIIFRHLKWIPQMILMSILTLVGWVLFRSTTVNQIAYFLTHVSFSFSVQTIHYIYQFAIITIPLFLIQIHQMVRRDMFITTKYPFAAQVLMYGFLLFGVVVFGAGNTNEFIYFQF